MTDYASVALVVVQEESILLVKELSHPTPLWKLPGGHKDPHQDEDEIGTSIRETEEESGVVLDRRDIVGHSIVEDRGDHLFVSTLFRTNSAQGLRKIGGLSEDSEVAGIFPLSILPRLIREEKFLTSHVGALEAHHIL